MAQLTAYEQYMLELANRARLDPAAEAQHYGVDLGAISSASKQPLAGNDFLAVAAERHSRWMLDTDTFSHTGDGGSSAGQRMTAAGYKFTGSWSWGENIVYSGTTGTIDPLKATATHHANLFQSAGHRANILNDGFREIGIGIETGEYKGYNAAMTTQNFAKSGTLPFLTGVAYTDRNGDAFYTPGEGQSGVRLEARPTSGSVTSTTTAAAGGYEAALAAGIYDVTFSGGGLAQPLDVTLAIASKNVKFDLIGPDAVACSTSLTMGANVQDCTLLGTENLQAIGNALDNVITGNAGDNTLVGGAGADTLTGSAGNDTFVLRAGETSGDRILDFSGNGAAAGDSLRFEGYRAGATLTSRGNGQWQVSDGVLSETFTLTGALDVNDYGFVAGSGATPPPSNTPPSNTPPPVAFDDPVTGTSGNDRRYGSSSANTLGGGAGDDRLYGNRGNDTLYGGAGDDYLSGGSGNDILVGGLGSDRLRGGSGADRFVIRSLEEGGDTMLSFSKSAGDRLDLAALFDGFGYDGTNPFADGYVRTVQRGSDVRIDVDANGGGDAYAALATVTNVTTSVLGHDFIVWS